MGTTITVETDGLPSSKFKVGRMLKRILITIDEKEGVVFQDVSDLNVRSESELLFWSDKSTVDHYQPRPLRVYTTDDKKIGESWASAVGPGGVRSKFEYYVNESSSYYSVRLGPRRYNRYELGRLNDTTSRIAQIHNDIQRFKVGELFNQTSLEKSNMLPFSIKINRSILKSALEILEILGHIKRVKDDNKLTQKFRRVAEHKEAVIKS